MGTTTYVMKFDQPSFPIWQAEHWLGHEVEFKLCGNSFVGKVVSSERHYLCNGIHDILEVEVWDGDSQVKIQAHRQKFRRV